MNSVQSVISMLLPGRQVGRPGRGPAFPAPAWGNATGPGSARTSRPIRVLLIVEACGGGAGRHVLDQ